MPRSFADFVALMATFPAIDPGNKAVQVTPHAALLKNLGIQVIGEHEGSQKIEIYCEATAKTSTLGDINRLTFQTLVQYCGFEKADAFVHPAANPPAGKVELKEVKTAMAAEAASRMYVAERKMGAGVWECENAILLNKGGSTGILNGRGVLENSSVPFYKGHVLDLTRSAPDWYESGKIERMMVEAKNPQWSRDVFAQAKGVFEKWNWKYEPSPEILASLVICTWLQSLWDWRPQVAIAGNSSTGKSMLMEQVLKEMFGALAFYVFKPSEAAIRNFVKSHSVAILIDEFEDDKNRQKVLGLLRTGGRGGEVVRGTSDQKGVRYGLKHIPWVASIETGLKAEADRNRFIMFELLPIVGQFGRPDIPSPSGLRELGLKLLVAGLVNYLECRRIKEQLAKQAYSGVPGRVIESFALPCSMLSAIAGHTVEQAIHWQEGVLGGWDFGVQQGNDQVDLLGQIFAAHVMVGGGKRLTVSQLIKNLDSTLYEHGTQEALHQVGITKVNKRKDGTEALFLACNVIEQNLIGQRSSFAGHSLEQYLMRVKGAKRDRQRLGGHDRFYGVSIPLEEIKEIFGWNEKDESGEFEKAEIDGLT